MPISVLMPALSPTMTEGNLVKWLKNEGDIIKAGQVLAEIETDKATMEVEAVDEGILGKILIAAGTDEVKVNTPIAVILEEGEDAASLKDFLGSMGGASESSVQTINMKKNSTEATVASVVSHELPTLASAQEQKNTDIEASGRIFASPLAKRIAGNSGIDLAQIAGTGPRGRVIKADVLEFKPGGESAVAFSSSSSAASKYTVSHSFESSSFEDLPLNNMRKIIARRLQESKQTIPHFYLSVNVEIDALLTLRTQINALREKEDKISVNDFVILATGKALQDVPDANVSFHDNVIRRYHQADIAVAVAIKGGLVTPIITHVGGRSLSNISTTMKSLAVRAREGKLQPHEFQGGSFCISNLGMYGVDQFQAIINPPQACILAIGAGKEQATVKKGVIGVATLMNCTLSVDHRAVDGALGAQFLSTLKSYLENPITMMV